MRYINGVYTQRFNRMQKTDGPLFRGRYKSVLVDKDSYLLQLSRYIHRNPIDMKRSMVAQLEDYPWSSFTAYINKAKSPDWLYRDNTYQMLGKKQKYVGYQFYVTQDVDDELASYYSEGNMMPILGDYEFRESVKQEFDEEDLALLQETLRGRPTDKQIIAAVSKIFKVKERDIQINPVGRRFSNPARAFAMYICQHYGGLSLKELAEVFGLSNSGSASFSIDKVKKGIASGQWVKEIKLLEKALYMIK